MGTAVLLVVAILLPTAAGFALLAVGRVWRWWRERPREAPAEPIESISATLRRLHAQLEAAENQPPAPGKGLRVRAMRAAYLDALGAACCRLGVDPPHPPVALTEIYRVEADLRRNGLDVRRAA